MKNAYYFVDRYLEYFDRLMLNTNHQDQTVFHMKQLHIRSEHNIILYYIVFDKLLTLHHKVSIIII